MRNKEQRAAALTELKAKQSAAKAERLAKADERRAKSADADARLKTAFVASRERAASRPKRGLPGFLTPAPSLKDLKQQVAAYTDQQARIAAGEVIPESERLVRPTIAPNPFDLG